jgi:glyoxylate/hydroxypyruvate reductase A
MLFSSPDDPADIWVPELQRNLPELEIRVAPDLGGRADIDYAIVWKPPAGLLASLPNLKVIFSIGAGIDHILADPERPAALPIVRMVDPYLRDMMCEYALLGVLYFHRFMPEYQADQHSRRWQRRWPHYTPETTVGVLGLGEIGAKVAESFRQLGFRVRGWSRTAKRLDGIECFHGRTQVATMLSACQYLVCVLPLTVETAGILDAAAFAALPLGAVVVSIGRGRHVVEADLLAALDTGHVGGAFLDVYASEPPPPEHRFWRHPRVVMTPHIAGEIVPKSCARVVAANVRRHLAGEPIPHVVDLARGY